MKVSYLKQFQKNFFLNNIPKVDYQIHTSWTDGVNSVREMYDHAVKIGITDILFSEHVRKTSGSWFCEFVAEVRDLPDEPCHALVGVEARIEDFEGNLDCTSEILTECDIVLASVHRFPDIEKKLCSFEEIPKNEVEDIEFRLSFSALKNPFVDILSHPFGMCYKRYNVVPSEDNIKKLISESAKNGVAFEINAYYHPDPWKLVRWCREAGANISLGSDAHSCNEIGNIIKILKGEKVVWSR